jgi:hypothetical protein
MRALHHPPTLANFCFEQALNGRNFVARVFLIDNIWK